MLEIKSFTFNPFQENTYVLYDETKEAVIVDPGCYEQKEKDILTAFIKSKDLKVVKLLNTHCHIDHVLGNAFVKRHYKVDLYIHEDDAPVLKAVEAYAGNYGFQQYESTKEDAYLKDGGKITFGNTTLDVIWVPGHAPGHVIFYHEESLNCIGGDTLFEGSIGRTDLPGGDHQTLLDAIRNRMFTLPDEVVVHPGHGPVTTIGMEKIQNPFVGKNASF
jgi:hydroxyacylglutathione hydrolase